MDLDDLFGEEPDHWFANDEGGEEEEEPDEDDNFSPGAQHVLVLVDCRPSMLEDFLKDPEFENELTSPLATVLKATEQIVRDKVRITTTLKTGKRDGFGVVLYNTRDREPMEINADTGGDAIHRMDSNQDDNDDVDDDSYAYAGPRKSTVHTLLPLGPPGVKSVLTIKNCTDTWSELDLLEEFGHVKEEKNTDDDVDMDQSDAVETTSPLQMALYEASQIFSQAKCVKKSHKKNEISDTKSVWIFTSDDDPAHSQPSLFNILKTAVDDLKQSGIQIYILPMPTPQQTAFDYDKFYDPMAVVIPAPRDVTLGVDRDTLDDVLADLTAGWKKTRRAFGIPLLLPDWKNHNDKETKGPYIMLDFYRLIQAGTKPSQVVIHQETGRELVKVVQKVSSTGDIIDAKAVGNTRITAAMSRSTANEVRLRSFVKFGGQGELVPMNKVDKVNIKKAGNANIEFASLILLGFKDMSAVPFMHTQEATYFAYPNDETVEGSCSAFAHLHASMLRKGVVAIGELLTRSNASSRLVVVTAVAEELVEEQVNGEIVVQLSKPPGMMVVGLPFEDEVRAMGPDEAVRSLESGGTGVATESIVDAACALIEHHPVLPEDAEIGRNFENVALKKLWDYIEHVALQEPKKTQKSFDTVVDKENVLKRAGEHIVALREMLPLDLKAEKVAGSKRKVELDVSGVDWQLLLVEGNVSTCTIPILKKKLRSIEGSILTGKKDDLVLRVEEYLQKEFGGKKAVKAE